MEYLKLKSGTDIRGVAVEGVPGEPVNLTDEVVETIAGAFLKWTQEHLKKELSQLRIAIGHDSRISADRISAALQRVFLKYGVHVLDCGLASTPSCSGPPWIFPVTALYRSQPAITPTTATG